MKKLLTAIASTAFLTFSAAGASVAQEVTAIDLQTMAEIDLETLLLSDENSYSAGIGYQDNETGKLTSVTLNGCTADIVCVSRKLGGFPMGEFNTGICIGEAMAAGNDIETGARCVINKGGESAYYSCVSGTCPNP